ncbi:hypothetical protein ABGV42_29865 [Paenibacillus pabuli]
MSRSHIAYIVHLNEIIDDLIRLTQMLRIITGVFYRYFWGASSIFHPKVYRTDGLPVLRWAVF